jgi:hypothetical protein
MRKLVAALFTLFAGIGAAQAAPDALKCTEKFDPLKPTSMNCFADEVFILNGAEQVTFPGAMAVQGPLVDCVDKMGMAGVKDSKNCLFGKDQSKYLSIEPLEAAALKAVELIRAKQPALPEWDEVVVFTADFGPTTATGPLFYRAANAMIQPINPVGGIGLGNPVLRDPAKPYIGIINAGNTKTIPANPATSGFGPCGTAPRRAVDDPAPQTAAALCAPALYGYFDALAQATANLYGPYLHIDVANFGQGNPGTDLVSMPAIKTTLVALMMNVPSPKITGGPATSVWSGFINTRGSLLGGNTFADNGNGTFSVTRPPAFQGVSAPLEGAQALRFQPIDLYVMGLLPAQAVPPVQSFLHATPGDVYQPAGVNAFSGVVGPAMGTRVSGVSIRGKAGSGGKSVPRVINFGDVIAASGGDRSPGYAQANQYIRQLWVMVSKPEAVIDAAVVDGAKKEDQLKDQVTQLTNVQRARRAFGQNFYALTGYKGRVYTTGDGNIDDNAYWEFGGARDDAATFQAVGPIKVTVPGPEEIPNSGGKQLSVLRVTETAGSEGLIRLDRTKHPIRIEGKQDIGSAPNNVLSVRMRVPSNPVQLAELKKDSRGEKGFYATFIFQGGGRSFSVNLPELEEGFLVPDGKFRTYSVNLGAKDQFKAGSWDSFTFIPSNREARDIEIEFIKVGWVDGPKDADKNCGDADQPDGWLDNVEDNCPKLYNPAQEDGNNDGVGDACEDYDGDNKLNSCDNCPTTTNTSQRDANGNKIGDACDGSKDVGCFFQESAVAGAVTPGSALFGTTLLVFGVMVAGAIRRRRRR